MSQEKKIDSHNETTGGLTSNRVDHAQDDLVLFGDFHQIDEALKIFYGKSCDQYQCMLKDYTKAICHGIGAVHRLHKCPPLLRKYLYTGIVRFLSQFVTESAWVSATKWLLTFPLARYLGNPEPSPPESTGKVHPGSRLCLPVLPRPHSDTPRPLFFPKRYHHWLRQRFATFSRKNTYFFTSWLQAKRSAEVLSSSIIIEAFQSHRKGMLTEDPMTPELLERLLEPGTNFSKLLELVKKKIHPLFQRIRDGRDPVSRPSLHASFLATRTFGGQRQDLISQCLFPYRPTILTSKIERGWDRFTEHQAYDIIMSACDNSLLVSMDYLPFAVVGRQGVTNFLRELRTTWIYPEIIHSLSDYTSTEDVVEAGPSLFYPRAFAAPVLEPLKVRMVSAGPARLYYSLKRVQMDLHSALRSIPLFRLVGRPQSPTDLMDIIPDDLAEYLEPRWLSADYKSATDNLSATLSREIMKKLLGSSSLGDRACLALGAHEVNYPPVSVPIQLGSWVVDSDGYLCYVDEKWISDNVRRPKDRELALSGKPFNYTVRLLPAYQTNGQLMGSIVSFIILCLANGAALDLYQRDSKRKFTFEQYLRSALINGDDLLTVVDGDKELTRFKDLSGRLGLDLTIGKSYIHDTYANINSTGYHHNLTALQKYDLQRHDFFSEYQRSDSGTVHKVKPSPVPKSHDGRPGHLPTPVEIDFFNSGLYAGKHKVMERVGSTSENPDVVESPDEYTTENHDLHEFTLEPLPPGARKLYHRLLRRGFKLPKEGDRPIFAIANRVVSGVPDDMKLRVEKEFHRRIRDAGEDIFFYKDNQTHSKWRWARRNHRVPISAGGLGLFQGSHARYRINKTQRQLARHLRLQKSEDGSTIETQLPPRRPRKPDVQTAHHFVGKVEKEFTLPSYDGVKKTRTYGPVTPLIPCGGPISVNMPMAREEDRSIYLETVEEVLSQEEDSPSETLEPPSGSSVSDQLIGEFFKDLSVFCEYSDDRDLVSPMYPKASGPSCTFTRWAPHGTVRGSVSVTGDVEHEYTAFYQRDDGIDLKVDAFGCEQY